MESLGNGAEAELMLDCPITCCNTALLRRAKKEPAEESGNFFQATQEILRRWFLRYPAKGDVSVLRASENPFSEDEFKSDVAKLTRAYIERPLFLGYPSSMTHGVGGLLTGMVGGGLAGLGIVGVIDTFVDVEHTAYAWSYLWSMLGGVVAFYGFSAVSELLNGLSNRNEYYLNESAANVIRSEETHARTVQLQRDLYTTLRGEGSNMSPQEFLGRFEQLPNKLINKSMDYRASGNNLADDPSFPALLQIVGLLPD